MRAAPQVHLTDTCSCGAKVEINVPPAMTATLKARHATWLEAHRECRDRAGS